MPEWARSGAAVVAGSGMVATAVDAPGAAGETEAASDEVDEGASALSSLDGVAVVLMVGVVGTAVGVEDVDVVGVAVVHGVGGRQ